MNNPIFDIKDVSLSYTQSKADCVLHIKELTIPKGEICFLLGASGSGKSTLLETLGLMNNTFAEGNLSFYPNPNEPVIDFAQLWAENQEDKIANFRRKHFSFIFQETNLMENFTAYQNVCLSRMIKEQKSQNETMIDAQELMSQARLPQTEVSIATQAANLSGGQRQRLAFVRALNTHHTVLFADEPTGNLDRENAWELMSILKKRIAEGATAVIVSHDINLALAFADRIIIINKAENQRFGEINKEYVFERKMWESLDTNALNNFQERLSNLFKTAKIDRNKPAPQNEKAISTQIGYYQLFLQNEGKALRGTQNRNLLMLSVILFLTFLSIGFANGSLAYLNEKMNDAFVNWMTISIPWMKTKEAQNIQDDLNSDARMQKAFGFQKVSGFVESPLLFKDAQRNDYVIVEGRSIDMNENEKEISPLLKSILDNSNYISGHKEGFRYEEDLSLIVSQQFYTDLHLPSDAAFAEMGLPVFDTLTKKNIYKAVKIPIRTIVNKIPGGARVLYTEHFFQNRIQPTDNIFDIRDQHSLRFLFKGDKKESDKCLTAIRDFLMKHPIYSQKSPECLTVSEKHTDSFEEGQDIDITLSPPFSTALQDSLWTEMQKNSTLKSWMDKMIRTYDFGKHEGTLPDIRYDMLSVYFTNLDKVRSFSDTIFQRYNKEDEQDVIEVDIAKIKEKENFNFLSKITWIIAYLLITCGTISVSLFISNLLKMHLQKIQMNLGTFKAFGMDNKEMRKIYLLIIARFAGVALLLALLAATLIGIIVELTLAGTNTVEKGVSYFRLLDVNTLVTILILCIATFLVSRSTIDKILSKSPGDLIYGR